MLLLARADLSSDIPDRALVLVPSRHLHRGSCRLRRLNLPKRGGSTGGGDESVGLVFLLLTQHLRNKFYGESYQAACDISNTVSCSSSMKKESITMFLGITIRFSPLRCSKYLLIAFLQLCWDCLLSRRRFLRAHQSKLARLTACTLSTRLSGLFL